jgi:hypothetical protein
MRSGRIERIIKEFIKGSSKQSPELVPVPVEARD